MEVITLQDDLISEQQHILFVYLLLTVIVAGSFFVFINFQRGTDSLAYKEIVLVSVASLTLLLVKKIKTRPVFRRVALLFLILCYLILLSILSRPSASDTVFAWIFLIPTLTYPLLGKRLGLVVTAIFSIASLFIYFLESGQRHQTSLYNVIVCLMITWFMAHLYEKSNVESKKKLLLLSSLDPLTGLYNRKVFLDIYQKHESCKQFTNIIIDIDFFKQINDNYGHDAGDQALIFLANKLKKKFKDLGYVLRIGGEEFCILLPDIDLKRGATIVEDFLSEIREIEIKHGNHKFNLTFSGGVSEFPSDSDNCADLLKISDSRLYDAKASGRNCIISQ